MTASRWAVSSMEASWRAAAQEHCRQSSLCCRTAAAKPAAIKPALLARFSTRHSLALAQWRLAALLVGALHLGWLLPYAFEDAPRVDINHGDALTLLGVLLGPLPHPTAL